MRQWPECQTVAYYPRSGLQQRPYRAARLVVWVCQTGRVVAPNGSKGGTVCSQVKIFQHGAAGRFAQGKSATSNKPSADRRFGRHTYHPPNEPPTVNPPPPYSLKGPYDGGGLPHGDKKCSVPLVLSGCHSDMRKLLNPQKSLPNCTLCFSPFINSASLAGMHIFWPMAFSTVSLNFAGWAVSRNTPFSSSARPSPRALNAHAPCGSRT